MTCYSGGPEAVYAVDADQHLTAAYYRNTVAHFFVPTAIAELALLRAAEDGVEDRERAFWNETNRLRDLLKFEFFFSDKETFRREIAAEAAMHDPNWKQALAAGPEPVLALLKRFRPFSAHLVLRPFLEAYQVVADVLVRHPIGEVKDEDLLGECLGLGKQYRLQRRIRNAESISKVLFATALRLARNRQLVPGAAVGGPDARRAFAAEIRDVIRRSDAIDALAAARRAGIAE
jgi:glycerol-3-phosphate O-acyltransferase